MKTNKLIVTALVIVLLAGCLMASNIFASHKEILSLRQRVQNLELIINYELIDDGKLAKSN